MAGAVKRKPVGPEPKLTPQLAELFLNTIRQTGNFRAASDKCAVAAGTVYRWCQEGATEKVGHPKRDLSDAVARARGLSRDLFRAASPAFDRWSAAVAAHG